MDTSFGQFMRTNQADKIVRDLQRQQHLHPHRALHDALMHARDGAGFCSTTAERAVATLHLDPLRKIGRLKRCELVQLARVIHRLWQQVEMTGQSLPA